MRLIAGLAATAVVLAVLAGCAPPRPAAFVQEPPVVRDSLHSALPAESAGGLPSMPWPRLQSGVAARAGEAELAIILRGHELRERHPGASPGELAELLARDRVWDQHARFVRSESRTVVVREALTLW